MHAESWFSKRGLKFGSHTSVEFLEKLKDYSFLRPYEQGQL
jgi:hypothetical protein